MTQIDARPSPFGPQVVRILRTRFGKRRCVVQRLAPGVVGVQLQSLAEALHQVRPEGIVARTVPVIAAIQIAEVRQQPPGLNVSRAWGDCRVDGIVADLPLVGRPYIR